jgi:hypothetical protein
LLCCLRQFCAHYDQADITDLALYVPTNIRPNQCAFKRRYPHSRSVVFFSSSVRSPLLWRATKVENFSSATADLRRRTPGPLRHRSMRRKQLGSFLLAAAVTSSVSAEQPFFPAQTPYPQAKLVRRQDCIPNFYSCADQGPAFNGVCCQNGQRCEPSSCHQVGINILTSVSRNCQVVLMRTTNQPAAQSSMLMARNTKFYCRR